MLTDIEYYSALERIRALSKEKLNIVEQQELDILITMVIEYERQLIEE